MRALRVILVLLMLALAGAAAVRGAIDSQAESGSAARAAGVSDHPASAPPAAVPVGGTSGWASHYGPGNGVAMHFCTWTLRHASGCGWVQIQSADTGLVVEAPVVDYCLCRVEPSSHPERIVDLQYGVLASLGLEQAAGLYPVTVWLIPDGPVFLTDPGIPDTAMQP